MLRRLFLSLAVAAAPVWAQSGTEVIRGRVFGPDSLPVARAEVIVTGLVSRMTQTARTDAKGVYTLVFANPEGEYLVAVRRVGFAPLTFRLSRTGMSAILGGDVHLKGMARVLDPVEVTAGRTTPPPGTERTAVGEVATSALADSLFLLDPSKLMALLMSIPGMLAIDDSTFSILGAAASQNITTLEGTGVRGAVLPPDAIGSTRVIASSADPARGGFAGASIAQTLRGGTDVFSSTLRMSNSNRALVWNDPAWTNPIAQVSSLSGTANGPIKKGKLRYAVSWSATDNTTDWFSLLNPKASLLSQQGISLDSVAAVNAALQQLGVPRALTSGPRDATRRGFGTSEVIDFTPTATTSLRFSHTSNKNASRGVGASMTSFPTRTNDIGNTSHSLNTRYSGYFKGLLNEMTVGVSYFTDYSDPNTFLPGGSVRVGTSFADGRSGLSSLGFGGGTGEYYSSTWSGEAFDELSWLPKNGKHRLKIGGRVAWEQSKWFYFPGSSLLGTYTYLSIEDLAANRPSSYERVITNTARNTWNKNSSLWVGEEWKASPALQLQGGLRFDFAHPGTIPRYNPVAEEQFGVRTDRIPLDAGISPRIGFSWTSRARRGQGSAGGASTLGGIPASAIASMSQELVTSLVGMQRSSTLPGIGVSGTIGAYRGLVSTSTIADLVESTGLPGTRVTLSCVGVAVPIPDWSSMTEGPTACADGTTGTTFSIARPLVRVFDPDFRAPLSWRANVGIDGIRAPGRWIVGLSGAVGHNVNGQSAINLNLNRTPRFFLPGEGNRPVFAPLEAIVPASGSISPGASRISPDFAAVTNIISDIRGYDGQLSASIAPPNPLFNRRVSLSFAYTLAGGRAEARGTSRIGTAGDPFVKQWVPSSQPVHTLRFTTSGRVWWFNFGLSSYLISGIPITPLVSGDVNGDGFGGNDRAFIPNPATTADTALSRQMSELIAHAPSGARECLTSQLGRMAGANSCHTPWQARFDVSASVTPPSSWNYNDRFRVTINIANASGALVRALGLEDTPFGQSTLATTRNPTLLYVTGFDTVAKQFRYRVNQLFGQPTNYGSARRRFGPTQVSLGVEYRFGGPLLNPIARGLGLREAVGKPELTDDERRAAVAKLKRDPAAPFVQRKDSLALTTEQLAQFGALSTEYSVRADTALRSLTNWVVKKGRRIFDQDLGQRLSSAQSALGKLNIEYAKRAESVLTGAQVTAFKAATAPPARK